MAVQSHGLEHSWERVIAGPPARSSCTFNARAVTAETGEKVSCCCEFIFLVLFGGFRYIVVQANKGSHSKIPLSAAISSIGIVGGVRDAVVL